MRSTLTTLQQMDLFLVCSRGFCGPVRFYEWEAVNETMKSIDGSIIIALEPILHPNEALRPRVLCEGRGLPRSNLASICGKKNTPMNGVVSVGREACTRAFFAKGGACPPSNLASICGKKNTPMYGVLSVGREGVEPSRCHHRRILSPLRLPIPPSPQASSILSQFTKTRIENRESRRVQTFTILRSPFSIHDFRKAFTVRARME